MNARPHNPHSHTDRTLNGLAPYPRQRLHCLALPPHRVRRVKCQPFYRASAVQVVEFNGWSFEVDREATEAAYAAEVSSTVECGCSNCRRFDTARYDLLHPDARALLERLGVDVAKETELVNFGPDSDERDIWSWLYNFVGRSSPYQSKPSERATGLSRRSRPISPSGSRPRPHW